jgi:hypothetical protein
VPPIHIDEIWAAKPYQAGSSTMLRRMTFHSTWSRQAQTVLTLTGSPRSGDVAQHETNRAPACSIIGTPMVWTVRTYSSTSAGSTSTVSTM